MPLKFLGPHGGSTADAIAAPRLRHRQRRPHHQQLLGRRRQPGPRGQIEEVNAVGQLLIAAACNSGVNTDSSPDYPSSYRNDNIISVAATDHDDGLASFSNYGATSVDLGAPGVSVLSTVPRFAKTVLVGADTDSSVPYHSAFHTFGLEGVVDTTDRTAVLGATLAWMGVVPGDPITVVDDNGGASFQSATTPRR